MVDRLISDMDGPSSGIHLRRLPVAEALYRLDRYLDEVFVAGLVTVRVVHGKGTGVMRTAVQEALSAHPLVKSFRNGYVGEGDAGGIAGVPAVFGGPHLGAGGLGGERGQRGAGRGLGHGGLHLAVARRVRVAARRW